MFGENRLRQLEDSFGEVKFSIRCLEAGISTLRRLILEHGMNKERHVAICIDCGRAVAEEDVAFMPSRDGTAVETCYDCSQHRQGKDRCPRCNGKGTVAHKKTAK